jgi:hypothetical protein
VSTSCVRAAVEAPSVCATPRLSCSATPPRCAAPNSPPSPSSTWRRRPTVCSSPSVSPRPTKRDKARSSRSPAARTPRPIRLPPWPPGAGCAATSRGRCSPGSSAAGSAFNRSPGTQSPGCSARAHTPLVLTRNELPPTPYVPATPPPPRWAESRSPGSRRRPGTGPATAGSQRSRSARRRRARTASRVATATTCPKTPVPRYGMQPPPARESPGRPGDDCAY